ncbi:MAG: methyltransferase [Chloroflexi bacterium]|nr:methyltransferase [Chloroflexota bacterium]
MTSRERVLTALEHREPDRVPFDMGSSSVTGIHVSTVYRLRQALGLDAPGTPVKIIRPYLMLGEMAQDLVDALGVDVVQLAGRGNTFGFSMDRWKEWTTFDGTPALVPEDFNTDLEPNGDLLQYPRGDKSVPPSGRMPAGGWYFDAIIRQPPIDDASLDPADNLEEFGLVSDEELAHLGAEVHRLHERTDKAIMAKFSGTGFGDIAAVPAPALKNPRGIRDVEEWYISTVTRRDYIHRVFERQCEIALTNLERIYSVVGDRVTIVYLTGTDFGMQTGPFISRKTYHLLFEPFHKAINDWVHAHTTWKTFIHSCGSVVDLIDDFIDAGFDILNPVQCSAAGMDPVELKRRYGGRIVFYGGGVDTQHTLPFGSSDDVRHEVRERIRTFAPGGGFVFTPVHCVQPLTPAENILAMVESVREHGAYPIC